jgi:hypothetical protein
LNLRFDACHASKDRSFLGCKHMPPALHVT